MTMNRAGDCCQNKEVFFGTHAGYEKEKLFNLFKAIIDYYKKLLLRSCLRICTLAIV